MRRGRLRPQPRGVRGDPPLGPRAVSPQRQPPLLTDVVLESERLLLRRFRPEDVPTLRRWHADPRSMEHLGGPTDDPADTDRALERWNAHWETHGFGLLAGELRDTGALVVRGGPQYHRTWPGEPEVGWAVEPELWGRGLATELGTAALAWTFGELGFAGAVSITTEENLASRRVMAKLGFTFVTMVEDERSGGNLWVHRQDAPLD